MFSYVHFALARLRAILATASNERLFLVRSIGTRVANTADTTDRISYSSPAHIR